MEERGRKSYPSDLTDKQWEEIAPLYVGMRNCTWSKRELTDAVLYLVDSGCKWRQLPHDFPPYSTVHSFYRRARISGLWDKILEHLVKKTYERYPSIQKFCADAGYRGTFVSEVKEQLGLDVDISEKIKPHQWEKLPGAG